jgi:hypothetical protein
MFYSTNSFDYEYNVNTKCSYNKEMAEDDRNDTFSPLLDLAIEVMLNGSPCSSAHSSNTIATTERSSSEIMNVSSAKLLRPPRQSLPQESILDSSSVATSLGDDELSYSGLEMLGEQTDL